MDNNKILVFNTKILKWEEFFNGALDKKLYRKKIIKDADTGMEIRITRYPAGVINKWHTHPCAHGMYVLEGTLITNVGIHEPGTFIWFPEGVLMEHGATAESDVTVLFITNKSFEIHYQGE